MATNECGEVVPPEVLEAGQKLQCRGGAKYLYRDGSYCGHPVASINCRRATRFQSFNYNNHKVPLVQDWVAFRSPSGTANSLVPEPDMLDETLDAPSVAELEGGSVIEEVLDLINSPSYSPAQDSWLENARLLVERSVDQLLTEFIQRPYLHRVEHSIHCQLFGMLVSHPEIGQQVALGNGLGVTQLVHKEWPETIAREGNRRGSFDLVVLSPAVLRACPELRMFRTGHLAAPIVIEIGLDYDAAHLAGDAKKLVNSKPTHGYLIHLVREKPREPVAEEIILGLEAKLGIKTAYAWIGGGRTVVKRLNDREMTLA